MQAPECPVCYEPYDMESHTPMVFGCGHCICQTCGSGLSQRCPTCRNPSSLAVNYALRDIIEQLRNVDVREAPSPPPSSLPLAPYERRIEQQKENCAPLFKNFDVSQIGDHRETHAQYSAYMDMCALVDEAFDNVLEVLHVSPGEAQAFLRRLVDNPADAAISEEARFIVKEAHHCETFALFGAYMKTFDYSLNKVNVRIYWDTENVEIPADANAMTWWNEVMKGLERNEVGLVRNMRVHGYYCPNKKRKISDKHRDQMRSLSMELVACTHHKKEEVDRQLSDALLDQAKLLDPASTRFVIVSSDKDFVPTVRATMGMGFNTFVVHRAVPESDHANAISMFPSGAIHVRDLFPDVTNFLADCGRCNKLMCSCEADQRQEEAKREEEARRSRAEQQRLRDQQLRAQLVQQRIYQQQRSEAAARQQAERLRMLQELLQEQVRSQNRPSWPRQAPAPPPQQQGLNGVIAKWVPSKGFGFVNLENGRNNVFCHVSNICQYVPDNKNLYGRQVWVPGPGHVGRNEKGLAFQGKCVEL